MTPAMIDNADIRECYLMELLKASRMMSNQSLSAGLPQSFHNGSRIVDLAKLRQFTPEVQREYERVKRRRLLLLGRCEKCGKPVGAKSKYKCEYHLFLAREAANKKNAKKRLIAKTVVR